MPARIALNTLEQVALAINLTPGSDHVGGVAHRVVQRGAGVESRNTITHPAEVGGAGNCFPYTIGIRDVLAEAAQRLSLGFCWRAAVTIRKLVFVLAGVVALNNNPQGR